MSKTKRITGILFLIFLITVISLYALLPQLLAFLITASLKNSGLQVDELSVSQVTSDHLAISHARLITSNKTAINLKQLSVEYSIPQLISKKVESIAVQQLDIHLTDEKSDPFATLSTLQPLLEKDLTALIPLTSATVNSLQLHNAQGQSLLRAKLALRSDKEKLELDVEMQSQSGENRQLHIIQQQAGRWNLEAVDPDGSKLISANFEQAQDFPLVINLDANLEQLQPWALLLGIPLTDNQAAFQASTQAKIQLKPDYEKKTFQFKLDAVLQELRGPEITLDSVTSTMTGKAGLGEAEHIEITANTDLSIKGLTHEILSFDNLNTQFDVQLYPTKQGIQGSFSPGLEIEVHDLKRFETTIENASLKTVNEQLFNRLGSTGVWQFAKNSLHIKNANLQIGSTFDLSNGEFDIKHEALSLPLEGSTKFELDGTAQAIQQSDLHLTDNTLQSVGIISWKTGQNPVSIDADIELAAKQLERKSLSGNNALLRGKTSLTFNKDTFLTKLDRTIRLTIDTASIGSTKIDSVNISPLDELTLQWNKADKTLDVQSNQLEVSLNKIATAQNTISPSVLRVSFEDWKDIMRSELTGKLSGDSIKLVTAQQTFELKKTNTSFSYNRPIVSLSGNSRFQQSNSQIHFDLSHHVESGHGSTTFKSSPQTISSAISAIKTITPNWPYDLHLLGGTASFSGKANWEQADVSASAILELDNIDGHYTSTRFSGLDSSIDLKLLPIFKAKSRSLRAKLIETGTAGLSSNNPDFTNWDDIVTPEIVELILGNNTDTAATGIALKLKDTSAALTIDKTNLILNGKTALQPGNIAIHFDLSHNPRAGRGSATYRTDTTGIASAIRTLKSITPDITPKLLLVTGTTVLAGKANWQGTTINAAANLKLDNVGGSFGDTYFSGLNSMIDLEFLPKLRGKSRSFDIKLIDIGVPINQFSSVLDFSRSNPQKKPVMTFRNTRAQFLSGKISGKQIKLDLNQSSNHFTLAFHGVDLGELIKLQQVKGLNAIGKISGTIPFRLGPEGIFISNGKASADQPGGSLSYIPEDEGDALRGVAKETGVVLDVLRDFQYDHMDATAQYKPDGQLQIVLAIKGKSPEYDKNRPVHLNLNLDQNILSLLKSVRAINGLNERIDQAVQKHYKARQR